MSGHRNVPAGVETDRKAGGLPRKASCPPALIMQLPHLPTTHILGHAVLSLSPTGFAK